MMGGEEDLVQKSTRLTYTSDLHRFRYLGEILDTQFRTKS